MVAERSSGCSCSSHKFLAVYRGTHPRTVLLLLCQMLKYRDLKCVGATPAGSRGRQQGLGQALGTSLGLFVRQSWQKSSVAELGLARNLVSGVAVSHGLAGCWNAIRGHVHIRSVVTMFSPLVFASTCFCVLVGAVRWSHLVLTLGLSCSLLLLRPSCLILHARDKMRGVQYLLLMLVGIYPRFAVIVLGSSELACPINSGGSKNWLRAV